MGDPFKGLGMRRSISLLAMFAASVLSVGCTMCDNPYDYCSPVVEGGYSGGLAAGGAYDNGRPVPPPVFPDAPAEAPEPAEAPATTEPDYFNLP